jgi:transposase-like protein
MDESEHDVLAYMTFPAQHRAKLHSTNPLERLNKEVKRRADVVALISLHASGFRSPRENTWQQLDRRMDAEEALGRSS